MTTTTTTQTPASADTLTAPLGRRITQHPLFVVTTALVLLFVVFTVVNGPTFLSEANLRNMALAGAIILILAVGVTMVIITAGFDLSVGSVLVLSGVLSVIAMRAVGDTGWTSAIIGLLVAAASGAVLGAINGALVSYAGLNPIIVTLGTLGAALGLAQVVTGGPDLNDVPMVMADFGVARVLGVPWVVVVAAVIAIIAGMAMRYTAFGRHTYAIGSNSEAATRAGIKVKAHLAAIYMISGLLAGLAGWLSLAVYGTTNINGHSLDALSAATAALLGGASLFGGVGTIGGTVLGNAIPVVLSAGLVIAGLQSFWQQFVTGVVLIGAVYLDRVRRLGLGRRSPRRTR
ncbi:ABC transporter permease [Janibacter melonis]|uniref:ABC transporter permease n=1 Tax=Janibacter melonis TaxID=262209 RepID=UPI001E379B4F|nr:ABC transporter permease [Janibacter melonis]MCB5991188.1 ABC transporter permease [Janibacter melonis]